MNIQDTIKQIKASPATVKVGKAGLTDNIIKEIKDQLKKKNVIKVKMVKGALENSNKKDLAKELANKTDSEIVHKVGFVMILKKKV
jgi:RNA-binding protein